MIWWDVQIPAPVALAIVVAIGYLISRRSRAGVNDIVGRSQRELKQAQAVAAELEKIAWSVRQSLAKHHSSIARFKNRVKQLNDRQDNASWKELCGEAEEILKPTLQLAAQMANACDEIRQQGAHLLSFTEVRTDPLTGVKNRRGLDDALNAQFALMSRYGDVFSVALLDVDHFKRINDRDGHLQGDRVLQELANLLKESIRETDIIARYGGEEFMIVMPHTDLAGSCTFTERLRAHVERQLSITISGGVASAREGDLAETLIARADSALYHAKNSGRNCIYSHNGVDIERIALDADTTAHAFL